MQDALDAKAALPVKTTAKRQRTVNLTPEALPVQPVAKRRRDDADVDHTSGRIALRTIGHRHVKQFDLTARQYDMQLRNLDQVTDVAAHMESCFDEAIDHFRQSNTVAKRDKLGVEIDYIGLKLNAPILVSFRNAGEMDGWTMMRAIQRVLQSNQSIDMKDPLSITFSQLRLPRGAGRGKLKFNCDTAGARQLYTQANGHLVAMRVGDLLCFPNV